MSASVRKAWLITCRDVIGRKRQITVFAEDERVVMIGPPGETAMLAPLEVGRLRAALGHAVTEAVGGAVSG